MGQRLAPDRDPDLYERIRQVRQGSVPCLNPSFACEMIREFEQCGIECSLAGEERYRLADFVMP